MHACMHACWLRHPSHAARLTAAWNVTPPACPCSRFSLLSVSAVIGAAGSVAFGSASQLVARFPAKCGQALALGIVAAGPTVLLLQALLRIGSDPTPLQQTTFFLLAALCPLTALAAVTRLLFRHWHELQQDKEDQGTLLGDVAWDSASIDTALIESGPTLSVPTASAVSLPSLPPADDVPGSGAPPQQPPAATPPPRWSSLLQYIAEQQLLLPEASQGSPLPLLPPPMPLPLNPFQSL